MFHLRAGQQWVGTGGTFAVDTQDNGLSLDIKTSFAPINAFVMVDNDYNSTRDSDAYVSALSISPKGDNWKAKLFVGNANGAGTQSGAVAKSKAVADYLTLNGLALDGQQENVYVVGVSGSTKLGAVKLFGEFDYFTGDAFDVVDATTGSKVDTADAMGTQLFLDASLAATDALTVGAQLFYALGDDEDIQYTRIGNGFNGWDPVFDVGTSLSNEQIGFGSAFNIAQNSSANASGKSFTVASAGVVGGRLYTSFKASEALTLGGSAGYFTEEEDAVAEVSVMALAGGLVYQILPNATFQLQAQYSDGTASFTNPFTGVKEIDDVDFDSIQVGTGLFVTF
jgi:hypothetical protein